ncbi:unnamed protein product [Fraxinus pennsylvanica]|uniref:Thiamine pyrophosphate enzyme TPP-binding domain-containing protein n=1 Tax=Fraxinus pennsylvanica TaxID=56036 RepID=A0AAD2DJV1_9LAMI|nr:unnamed protein product [Fraxinus pennsylvanica]
MIGTDAFQETPIVEECPLHQTKINLLCELESAYEISRWWCLNSSEELRKFVELTGFPVASTPMGLGSYPLSDEDFSLQMLGMHGTIYGSKFDIGGERKVREGKAGFFSLEAGAKEQKMNYPLSYKTFENAIPHYVIQLLDKLTNGNAVFRGYGLGLPAAIEAAVARPDAVVVDIDGDRSFIMNVQELATVRAETLPVKIMLLKNQHLGIVVQWEDRFYTSNRAHTWKSIQRVGELSSMLKFAEGCDIPAAGVTKKDDLRTAIQKMLDMPAGHTYWM